MIIIAKSIFKKNLGFKDITIVPGQMEQSGPSTLVWGSYPH